MCVSRLPNLFSSSFSFARFAFCFIPVWSIYFYLYLSSIYFPANFALYCGYFAVMFWVYLGVKTCEDFLCFVAIVRVRSIMLTSLLSLFYVTGECHRFLHRG